MNFKTTLTLLVLVAAGATLFYIGPKVPFLFESPPAPADGGTRAALEKLKPEALTRIEIRRGDQTLLLTREKGVWSLPGKWPTRTAEVNALAELLGGLRSRFEAIPLTDNADLSPYGLHQPAATVKLETDHAKYHFILGEAPATSEINQFSRPTYLRLLNGPGVEKPAAEVVRLGPGLLALLDRPTDYYQQRRLFPSERVAKEDQPNVKVERLTARSVRVEDHKKTAEDAKKDEGVFALERKDKTWELAVPERDRLDPSVEEKLLAAVPDMWAERFVEADKEKTGLDAPERKLTVTRDNGDKVTLLIGKVSRTTTKRVLRPSPPGVPIPPQPQEVKEEYRYAKLEENPQVFEIKADGLKDVFVSPDTLRDARLARFNSTDATELEIVQPGLGTIQLVKEKDHWKLAKPLKAEADSAKVTELLTKLSGLEAHGEDIIAPDKRDPAAQGFNKPGATITVKWETEKKGPDGEKKKTTHSTTLKLGKDDTEKKKLYIKSDDLPRVNAVDDSLVSLTKRPALAYRGKRLLDFTANDVDKIDVKRGDQKLTLKKDKDGWKLTAPVDAKIDGVKAEQLADALGRLEVIEYVDDEPKPEQLDPMYGVGDAAALVVTVTFSDPSKPSRKLRLGKTRGTKPEYFGKMDDGASVFVVDALIHGQLDRDSLAYLPAELWHLQPEEIGGVRIKKADQDEYTLKRDGTKWQITGPFDAPALLSQAQLLADDLAAARCESHKALEAKELKPYGLDKPELTIAVLGKDGKEEHTLLIGAPIEKDSPSRYAMVKDKPGVCVLGPQLVAAADRPALELLDPTLLKLDPAKIDHITTKSGDTTLTLQRKGEGWDVLNTPASPFAADKDTMSAGQFPWANLRASKFAAYGPKTDWAKYGLDKPEMVVTIAAKDGEAKEHTVELGKAVEGDAEARYARVDKGQGVAVLDANTSRTLSRSYLDYVNRSVLEFKTDDVTQIQRKMGTEMLELTRNGDAWQIVKPAAQRADDKSLQDLVAQLANLKAVRVAAFPATDLKTYGLDDPAAVLTIRLKVDAKPTEYVVKLGKPDGDGPERFALVGDSKAVVVLPAALSKRLAAAPITFRDRSLARFADADKLRLEHGARQAVFARVEGSWKMTEPITADADNDELDEFLNTLAKLRADELVAEKPTAEELKTYGLDKPEARWKLFAGNTEVLNLVIGAREKVGLRRYAQLAGKDIVFLLDPKLSMRCVGEFRTRTVWPMPLDAASIESVRYGAIKEPFVLEKTETGNWQVVGKPEVKPITATVNETLAALAGLKLSHYVVDKGADLKLYGLEPPELAIDIMTRSGKRTLYIGRQEGDTKNRYARIPGENRSDVFVINEADAAKILREAAAFTKAPVRPMTPVPIP